MTSSDQFDAEKPAGASTTTTVERAIDILDAFTVRTPEMSLTEISEATGLHKATALRLLKTLAGRGLVARHPNSGRYALGFRLVVMAEVAKSQSGLLSHALPLMQAVREELNETVFLSVRAGDFRVDIEQVEARQELRQVKHLGLQIPLYAGAASKVFLASLDDAEIDTYLHRTQLQPRSATTIVDVEQLKIEIEKIRKQGYADSFDEINSGGAGVSAPVSGPHSVMATLSVTAPSSRFDTELRQRSITSIKRAAAALSATFGGS